MKSLESEVYLRPITQLVNKNKLRCKNCSIYWSYNRSDG